MTERRAEGRWLDAPSQYQLVLRIPQRPRPSWPRHIAASSDFPKVSQSEEMRRSTVNTRFLFRTRIKCLQEKLKFAALREQSRDTNVQTDANKTSLEEDAGWHVWGNQRQPVSKLPPQGLSSRASAPHNQYVQKLGLDQRRHERGRDINSN